jgi:uncharacterized protein DUF4136
MKRLVPLVCVLLLACSQKGFDNQVQITPQPVPDVNFSAYQTWDFGRLGEYPATGIEHIDEPQFRQGVAKHFADEMTKHGYTRATENPDLIMLLHVAAESKFDEQKMDDVYKGYDLAWAQIGKDDVWNEGTMVIFAMEGKTGKQVWSSTAQARLQDYVGFQDRLDRFNKVVTKMLADLPARTP